MALAEIETRVPKGAVQSCENRSQRKASKRSSLRLTESEVAELQELWSGYASQIGLRSVHGAVEARMLRSPPREHARRYVIVELQRCGGRCPETKLMHTLIEDFDKVLDVGLQRYEVRRAIRHLIARGRIERVEVPRDNGPTTYDLRIAHGQIIRLALASVPTSTNERESRWQAQDEALRLMWSTLEVTEDAPCPWNYEHGPTSKGHLGRSLATALESMTRESVAVLRAAYGTGYNAHSDLFGGLLGFVAPMTPSVLQERERRALALAASRRSKTRSDADLYAMALRRVRPEDVIRERAGDAAFVSRVTGEADLMLVRACAEFRRARIRG
jgi:hypothetical protein